MVPTSRAFVTATASLVLAATLAACATSGPAATPQARTPVVASTAPSAASTVMVTSGPTPAPTTAPTATAAPSSSGSQAPVVTIVPGSSLDPSLSDAGVAGRFTIPDDTRVFSDHFPGTHEILGREASGSDCSYSFSGDEFTANARYDDAPVGMLYQLAVSVSADEMPANDGEQRAGIQDGRVYADFHSESGIGGTYSADISDTNYPGMVTIDVAVSGDTYTFTFTGETWDKVAFSGQIICAHVTE